MTLYDASGNQYNVALHNEFRGYLGYAYVNQTSYFDIPSIAIGRNVILAFYNAYNEIGVFLLSTGPFRNFVIKPIVPTSATLNVAIENKKLKVSTLDAEFEIYYLVI